jgi:aminopeptidase N
MLRISFSLFILILILPACAPEQGGPVEQQRAVVTEQAEQSEQAPDTARDYFSFANSTQFATRHLQLDLDVNFDNRKLSGYVILHMLQLDSQASDVVLDSRTLNVEDASVSLDGQDWVEADFGIGKTEPIRGEPLTVTLPAGFKPGPEFQLRLSYNTDPGSTALQWLPPELTAGGIHPFMFSQSQSIHARSWVPLQDTPLMRVTYEAVVRTPPALLALMSADNDPDVARTGEYHFSMPQPIPSYLLALAVGDLHFAPVGDLTGVYAEPAVLEAAAWEFAGTQDMLDTAVEMYGDYQWGRYDLLILPPSFPFGGMENPRLSFITPSVLAGDRSLVSLIAHELAHSWSGNLVSNATWRDIWLNEGTTSYFEARLMEVLYGKARADEERVLGNEELALDFQEVSLPMQALAPRFDSGDPDDSQGTVHYHKGRLLLEHLESIFGRAEFDEFLAGYFRHFEFQAISSEQFLDYLDENLLLVRPGKFNRGQVAEWLYQPGLPDDVVMVRAATLEQAAGMATGWASGELSLSDLPVEEWSPQAVVHFINKLPQNLEQAKLVELDAALGFSTTRNAEIGRAWFIQVASRRHQPAYGAMAAYLNRFGRIRLIAPVYRALVENGEDEQLARKIFDQSRGGYHPMTVMSIEAGLNAGREGA